ncbi:MAG: glutathione synthase [Deltaproteobacteria bacterium]|nr:glutathione synthase [Deltaproteobacteria bacterium]
MRIAFIMDPLANVAIDKDTTFALMLEAQHRGHESFHLGPRDLHLDGGRLFATVRRATVRREVGRHFELGDAEDHPIGHFDVVMQRKDPPFDDTYLYSTLLLERGVEHTFVVNDPRGLRDANEKLYTCHFADVMTDTIVDCDRARIAAFVDRVGGHAIVKPLHGAGGLGVLRLSRGDQNFHAILELLTEDGRRLVMVQRYLPDVRKGDKRILLLDGEPLGAILRVPRADEARSNIHVGGSVVATELDDDDLRICARLRDPLRHDGLWFVGLDVIGGKLTEVNVTSPTGIQEMGRLDGKPREPAVLDWLEGRAKSRKRRGPHGRHA